MFGSSLEGHGQMLDIGIHASRNESCIGAKGNRHRIQWMIDGTHRSALRDLSLHAGRRILPLRQSIDSIVEEDHIYVRLRRMQWTK